MTTKRKLQKKEIALDGALKTYAASSKIKPNDFTSLINLRPKEGGVVSIAGQTRYNGTAISNVRIKDGINYTKEWPAAEYYNIVAAFDSNNANMKLYKNSTYPTATGEFNGTVMFTATDAGTSADPRFTIAPNNSMVMCDGTDTVLWYGDWAPIAGFVDIDTARDTYAYDYTESVASTTSERFAVVHTHDDSVPATECALLLHLDGTHADASGNTQAVAVTGTMTYSTATYKFGTQSNYFNGANCYLTVTADALFDWTANNELTFDTWLYRTGNNLPSGTLWSYRVDANNYAKISVNNTTKKIDYVVASGTGTGTVSSDTIQWVSYPVTYPRWNHIAVVVKYDGSAYWNVKFYLDGQQVGAGYTTYALVDASAVAMYIGMDYTTGTAADLFTGSVDELAVWNTERWSEEFTPTSHAYGASSAITEFLVSTVLPQQKLRLMVPSGYRNASAGTLTAYYWDGDSWAAAGAVTRYRSDGTTTITDGIPLSADGQANGIEIWSMATNNDANAKSMNYNETVAFWYKYVLDGCDANVRIQHVEANHNVQQIRDLWDGAYRPAASFLWHDASAIKFLDYTINVSEANYDSYSEATYAKLGDFNFADDALYIGSLDRLQSIKIGMQPGFLNTNLCAMKVSYWNGSAWVQLGIKDGTRVGNVSLAQSGIVSWDPPDVQNEFEQNLSAVSSVFQNPLAWQNDFLPNSKVHQVMKRVLANSSQNLSTTQQKTAAPAVPVQMFYYRITFQGLSGATLLGPTESPASPPQTTGVHVYSLQTVPAPVKVEGYKFPFTHNDSLFLCGKVASEQNAIIYSAPYRPQVFNGGEAGKLFIGDGSPVLAACSFHNLVGNAIVRQALVFKSNSVWRLLDDEPYRVLPVSQTVGCIAPRSVVIAEISEVQGFSKKVAVWLSHRGPVWSDGNTIKDLNIDVQDLWISDSPTAISAANMATAFGFFDDNYSEYHLVIPGTSEWVYNFRYQKWYQINRGTSAKIYGAFYSPDSSKFGRTIGWTWDGITYTLDYGVDFDYGTLNAATKNEINCTFQTGDLALAENYVTEETVVRGVKLIQVAKGVATDAALTHYGDTNTTGTTIASDIDPQRSGYLYKDWMKVQRLGPHVFHKFKVVTTQATGGTNPVFEPLFLSILWEYAREDVRQ